MGVPRSVLPLRAPEHSPTWLSLRLAHQIVQVEVALDHPSDQIADHAEEGDDQHVAEVADDQGESEQEPGDDAHCGTAHHRRLLLRCEPFECLWVVRPRAAAANLPRTARRRTNVTLLGARELGARELEVATSASYALL